MHPHNSNQCIVNTDLHVMLTKLSCALVQTREKMKFFEGKCIIMKYILNECSYFVSFTIGTSS